MNIGIIGAENSHCAGVAKTLNLDKLVPGFQVTHVWGETREFAEKAAEKGGIPNIVDNQTDMLGKIDGLMIDHRDGKYHLAAARPFVEAGVPVFVDKPFSTDLDEGIELARFAKSKGVAVTTFSTITLQKTMQDFLAAAKQVGEIRTLVMAGPCDVDDKYGGVFFYAIHQVEPICHLLPSRPRQVMTARHGADGVATITFESGAAAVINCHKDWWVPAYFSATAYGSENVHHAALQGDDNPYLAGIHCWAEMFTTGKEPRTPREYLTPIAILQAMRESFATGKTVGVKPVPEI